VAVPRIGKELLEELAYQPGLNAVIIVLAMASVTDEPGHAEKSQMMAHGRLRLFQHVAQRCNVEFFILGQGQQDLQTGFVGQQFKNLGQAIDRPF
jgi:hypothetical protein